MGKYAPGIIVDCATNTETYVELTQEEELQRDAEIAESLRLLEERKAEIAKFNAIKDSARSKLVAGEPLTVEEAATIVL